MDKKLCINCVHCELHNYLGVVPDNVRKKIKCYHPDFSKTDFLGYIYDTCFEHNSNNNCGKHSIKF